MLKIIRSVRRHRRIINNNCHVCIRAASNVFTSPLHVDIPNTSLHELIYKEGFKYPHHVALECAITGRKYTYEQTRILSGKVAASLQTKFKLEKGDAVAVVLPNCPEFPLIFLGASESGVIPTTVNPHYTADEIVRQLQNANAKLIFTVAENYSTVVKSVKLFKRKIPIVVIKTTNGESVPEGAVNFDELVDSSVPMPRHVDITSDDTAVLPYSSGTTGMIKGVQLTHANLVANLSQLDHPDVQLLRKATAEDQESLLEVLPMFHIFGMTVLMLNGLRNGVKVVAVPKFEPQLYMSCLRKYKPGVLYTVPPTVLFLGSQHVTPADLTTVRVIMSGGAPCGEKDAARLQDKLQKGSYVLQGYGLTETSPVVFNQTPDRYGKLASVGQPVGNTNIRIVDVTNGQNLPVNTAGEIYIQGPQVMKGYLNNDEANKNAFDEEGWFRTGDIGYYDNDGDFYISDRIKELIKVKGFQVAPAELEEILRSHPKIEDAAVIGIPDAKSGELPKGFIVVKQNCQITAKEVEEFVEKQVAKYKRLKGGIVFLEEIPKSASGKILRKDLKTKYSE